MFYGVPFYNTYFNTFNVSCLFSGGINISLAFLELSSARGLRHRILSAILFPRNSPVASTVLWTTFLKAVFGASSFVLAEVSKFSSFFYRTLPNDKNPYPLTYFLVLGSIE